jgi:uncharacterized protein
VPSRRTKRQPQRTCVGCREVLPKRALIRIVRGPDGVKVDPKGKAPGRGAYLHDRRSCWDSGLSGSLAKALKTDLTPDERQALTAYKDGLTDEQEG